MVQIRNSFISDLFRYLFLNDLPCACKVAEVFFFADDTNISCGSSFSNINTAHDDLNIRLAAYLK